MDKVIENRMRRMVARRGMRLVKSRRRDPYAIDFGLYTLERHDGMKIMVGTFPAISDYLKKNKKPAAVSGAGPT